MLVGWLDVAGTYWIHIHALEGNKIGDKVTPKITCSPPLKIFKGIMYCIVYVCVLVCVCVCYFNNLFMVISFYYSCYVLINEIHMQSVFIFNNFNSPISYLGMENPVKMIEIEKHLFFLIIILEIIYKLVQWRAKQSECCVH